MRTYSAKPGEVERKWYVVDASQYNLGRLATQIATIIRGKHKPQFTPHVDTGDYVVVVNASRVNLTGRKMVQKEYYNYSGYPGGLRKLGVKRVLSEDPERVIRQAVRLMLPKNRLSRQVIKKLKVYGGEEHPHAAQNPEPLPQLHGCSNGA
ncbi:MAG: 50S ribosomal protein L13 [Proteobacteria bacterium]|nr:50S ribosomal protein L13 [Pseudomonadota bacterium]